LFGVGELRGATFARRLEDELETMVLAATISERAYASLANRHAEQEQQLIECESVVKELTEVKVRTFTPSLEKHHTCHA
jgi:hypothetical protein